MNRSPTNEIWMHFVSNGPDPPDTWAPEDTYGQVDWVFPEITGNSQIQMFKCSLITMMATDTGAESPIYIHACAHSRHYSNFKCDAAHRIQTQKKSGDHTRGAAQDFLRNSASVSLLLFRASSSMLSMPFSLSAFYTGWLIVSVGSSTRHLAASYM